MTRLLAIFLLLLVGGCATVPTGPTVMVLPAPGKPFEVFQAEDAECRGWAGDRIGVTSAATANRNAAVATALSTLAGAGIGAAFGAGSGNPGAGAAFGAGGGFLYGSAGAGASSQLYGEEAQRRYDITYMQCMYAYGNQVPGTLPRAGRAAPPPPPPEYEPAPQGARPTAPQTEGR